MHHVEYTYVCWKDRMVDRAFTNILAEDVAQTCRFYEALLGLSRDQDFGWFCLLGHPDMPGFQLGILDRSHATVPIEARAMPAGAILTFVVPDVEAVFATAKRLSADILQAPTPLPYGQTRLLLRDPAGSFIDVSAPTR